MSLLYLSFLQCDIESDGDKVRAFPFSFLILVMSHIIREEKVVASIQDLAISPGCYIEYLTHKNW